MKFFNRTPDVKRMALLRRVCGRLFNSAGARAFPAGGMPGSEMGLARGGWGWGWDGIGVGLGTGLLVAGATLSYYVGY